MSTEAFTTCADLLDQADGLIITAGAGMGVDSGLPDFRGNSGFWQAYPALAKARIAFHEIASPDNFHSDPQLAWGFYGHRLALYRATEPHRGFALLAEWASQMPQGGFVFTSNVDGQFQKAGFDDARIYECHGSIHHLQCLAPCSSDIWVADTVQPEIDAEQCRMAPPLPRCPRCGGLARPNILMFGDDGWIDARLRQQASRLQRWLATVERPLVIELGAGTAIPTVRHFGESLDVPIIRINPTEPQLILRRGVSLAMGALEGLAGIAAALAPPTR